MTRNKQKLMKQREKVKGKTVTYHHPSHQSPRQIVTGLIEFPGNNVHCSRTAHGIVNICQNQFDLRHRTKVAISNSFSSTKRCVFEQYSIKSSDSSDQSLLTADA